MGGDGAGDLFSQAVAIVKRDRKASTSYIRRRLQIGYNRAASLMERMELEGIVGQANHAGKRKILSRKRRRILDPAAQIGPGPIIFTEKRYLLWSKAR